MIQYDVGFWHIGFIFRIRGSTFLKASLFAVPAAVLSFFIRWMVDNQDDDYLDRIAIGSYMGESQAWAALNIVIGLMLAARSQQALSRFWEGLTLVHQMSAEWYDATSSLVAFSHWSKRQDLAAIDEFQHTVVRVMSLMHGSALHQIKEGSNEDFEAIGLADLDTQSLRYLQHCKEYGINRVEVLLHWVHELVTQNCGSDKVLSVPAPILTRVYQELSRGMVHLNDARKITETPFPFPLAQVIVILLLLDTVLIPVMVAMFVENPVWSAIFTYVCTLSLWCVNLIAGEIEQPFGNDANDLPLSMLQTNLNRSLLVLLDPRAQKAPMLRDRECTERVSVENAHHSMISFADEYVRSLDITDLAGHPLQTKSMDLTDLAADVLRNKPGFLGNVSAALGAIGRRLSLSMSLGGGSEQPPENQNFGVPSDELVLGVSAIKGPMRQSSGTRSKSDMDILFASSPENVSESEHDPVGGEVDEDKDVFSLPLDPVILGAHAEQPIEKNHRLRSDSKSSTWSDTSSKNSPGKKSRRGAVYSTDPHNKDAVSAANVPKEVPALLEPVMEQSCERNKNEFTAMASPMRSTRSVPWERTASPNQTRQRPATRPRTPSPSESPRTNITADIHV